MPISQDELERIIAETNERFGPPPQRNTPADIESSLHDYLLMASGRTVHSPEPLAHSWHRHGLTLAEVRSELNITTSDFAAAMDAAGTNLLRASFGNANADIAAMTRAMPVTNYRPQSAASLSISDPEEVQEDEPLPDGVVTVSETGTAGLREYGMRLSFSRPLWMTHGQAIVDAMQEHGSTFSLIEMKAVAALLESATLTASTTTALDASGLGKASAALRNQTNGSGAKLNLPLSVVVVPPALEHAAYVLKFSSGRQFRIVANAYLSSATTWYAMTDPRLAAPIRRMTLRGAGQPSLIMDAKRSAERGARFALSHSVGFLFAGTAGCVKCTA